MKTKFQSAIRSTSFSKAKKIKIYIARAVSHSENYWILQPRKDLVVSLMETFTDIFRQLDFLLHFSLKKFNHFEGLTSWKCFHFIWQVVLDMLLWNIILGG